MDAEPRGGLEEYAETLDLKVEDLLALLDCWLGENAPAIA